MPVAAIILAAGSSTRLGQPKQLATLAGEPLLRRAIRTAQQAGLSPVLVVLGANAAQIRDTCNLRGATVIVNKEWQEGMASSVRAGTVAAEGAEGVVLMTCDQPAVTAQHLQKLIQQGQQTGEPVASAYAERSGVPAYFPGTRMHELLLLKGDAGARGLLASAKSIELNLGEIDVDTPEALARARELFATSGA